MENLSLTPATRAVLDALTDLGQGNLQELAAESSKARSTTDKAIKTLADAGVIVAVETDPADDTPTRWTLATPDEGDDAQPGDAPDTDPSGEHTTSAPDADGAGPGLDHAADQPESDTTEQADQDTQPGAAADDPDGDDAGGDDAGDDAEDQTGDPDDDAEDQADDPDEEKNEQSDSDAGRPATVAQPARPGDRKVMAIKGLLADYGDHGATLDVIVADSGISHPTAARLLAAMEQADAARRLGGRPERWITGPTKASQVDPNPQPPRCPLCHQVIRGAADAASATARVQRLIQPDGTLHVLGPDGETRVVALPQRTPSPTPRTIGMTARHGDGTVNADGSQPFGRGELEKLTLDVLAAHPGRAMTPQDIAGEISRRLGRTVSSGAVRNNCTKAAAAGRILLVSDTPLSFAYPAPTDNDTAANTADGDPDTTEQTDGGAERS